MQKQNVLFLSLIAVALAITIPIAYSAVEPSIIINMESGQTTKPLQVKDSGGSEVFSVDVDGTLFPSQSITKGTEVKVLNNQFDDLSGGIDADDDDAQGFDSPLAEFTLPSTSVFWKITGLEFKYGDTTVTKDTCMAVLGVLDETLEIPLSSLDTPRIQTLAFGCTNFAGFAQPTDTVNKIVIKNSLLLDGGDSFLVGLHEGAGGSSYTKQPSGTSGAVYNQGNIVSGIFDGGEFSQVVQIKQDSSEFYLVVYATPFG